MCWANLLARMLDEVDSRKLDLARNFNLPRPRPGLAEVGKVASCSDEQIDVSVVDLIEDAIRHAYQLESSMRSSS